MHALLRTLPNTLIRCFSRYNLVWHLVAIVLTYIFVVSGFDWFYFEATRSTLLQLFLFPAIIGGLLPIILPLTLLALGKIRNNVATITTAWALGQAEIIGLLISSFYKAVSGRVPPEFFASGTPAVDMSRNFQFGFLRGGIFWGWPSSHTTLAFAMAVTLCMVYPKNKTLTLIALLYALYVGIGVSISIHWFSDFAAGAIIGSVIGTVVSQNVKRHIL